MKFRAKVLQAGKTATGIRIPPEVMDSLGAGKKPAVRITINGHTYRSTVATVDGLPTVGVSAENRAAAGVAGGDDVEVEIALDTAPREVTVPPDFAAKLKREPAAQRTFEALSYSNRNWHVLQIEGAKTPETRARRIERSVAALREGRPR